MRSSTHQRVALVTPFFAPAMRGRKERYAFAYATHLALEGVDLDVLTTTAIPEEPAANFFVAGVDHTEPFPVHRFSVEAPDRVAYQRAQLGVQSRPAPADDWASPIVDERVRSPALLEHIRACANQYDAFLFIDLMASTTVYGMAGVADRTLLAPLLDDEPAARLTSVAAAVRRARLILCATEAEALLVAERFGPAARARVRIVGLGADVVPQADVPGERVRRLTGGRPYVLFAGDDPGALAEMRRSALHVVELAAVEERDRPAFFAFARAVAFSRTGLTFVPEVVEAWAYRRCVLASDDSPGAAALVRGTGGGIIVRAGDWHAALDALPPPDALRVFADAGAAYVAVRGGWRRVAQRTAAAIESLDAIEDGRSRDELIAQLAYLSPLVQRQRRTIEAMRVSRFWALRDAWFAVRRRLGIGPAEDPVRLTEAEEREVELASVGDPYQLFREHHRLRDEEVARMRTMTRLLPKPVEFAIVVDARARALDGVVRSLRSLQDQVYERWSARVLVDLQRNDPSDSELLRLAAEDRRIAIVAPGGDRFGGADVVGPLDPYDRLPPHALFELALAFQEDVDIVYSDEDRLDDLGVPGDPWFKPDWSPETLLTRDVVGRACMLRTALLIEAGGVRDVYESAKWYEAVLRASERTDRIAHIPQVLCHRHRSNVAASADLGLAVEIALRRRGEPATTHVLPHGVEVRYAVDQRERVCVVVPARERSPWLERCLEAVFSRTAFRNFEVIVATGEPGAAEALTQPMRYPADRFRVLETAASWSRSRACNEAVRSTDAPFVVLLSDDAEVSSPEWMEAMLGQARRPAIGAVGALLLRPDGTVHHGGIVLGIGGLIGYAHRSLPGSSTGYHGALAFDTNYLAVSGACLMMQRGKYLAVGGLDEALAGSYDDVDLCLRLRSAGFRNVFVPRARLTRHAPASADDLVATALPGGAGESATVRSRWASWAARDPYYNPNLTLEGEDFALRL